MRFEFGKNWSAYVKDHLTDDAIATATAHLSRFLGMTELSGRSFLDVGCGSGVHALAALKLGCSRVVAFDFDSNSVETSRTVLSRSAGRNWSLHQGSILDKNFVSSLGTFDVVFSWGVLHHTGNMWEALENAARCVSPGGYLYIALYEKETSLGKRASFWMMLKKFYNRSGWITRRCLGSLYILAHALQLILNRHNPLTYICNYRGTTRGMNYITDVRDWLGGWPMEFASINEVIKRMCQQGEYTLSNLTFGEANTEYLFRKAK